MSLGGQESLDIVGIPTRSVKFEDSLRLWVTNGKALLLCCYNALEAHKKCSSIDNLSTQSTGYLFLACFIRQ